MKSWSKGKVYHVLSESSVAPSAARLAWDTQEGLASILGLAGGGGVEGRVGGRDMGD